MIRGALTIVRIAGVPVRIHWTFLLLLGWVYWTGAFSGGSAANGVRMVGFVLAVFACVVAHEFGHIAAARAFGIRTRDVTLLPIGGVASLARMPEKPWQELVVAAAGPAVNVVIAAVLAPVSLIGSGMDSVSEVVSPGEFARTFASSLAGINIWLVLFNLVPAFPMDGGRMLRAVVAMFTDRVVATRIAAGIGRVLAVGMGLVGLFYGMPMLMLLAFFVFMGAGGEAAAVEAQAVLEDVPVSAVMTRAVRTVGPGARVGAVVDELLADPHVEFAVTRDGTREGDVVGVLARERLAMSIGRGGAERTVEEEMETVCVAARPADSAAGVLKSLQEGRCRMVPVVEDGMLVGLVGLEQFRRALTVRGSLRRRVENTGRRGVARGEAV